MLLLVVEAQLDDRSDGREPVPVSARMRSPVPTTSHAGHGWSAASRSTTFAVILATTGSPSAAPQLTVPALKTVPLPVVNSPIVAAPP